MTSSSICLFHNRQYSSNIQCILNLLRINIIKIKCDLNLIAKSLLCTCNLSDHQMIITDDELNTKQREFEKIKSNLIKLHQWPQDIDQILQHKILKTCDTKLSIYKLLKLICDISNEEILIKTTTDIKQNQYKSNRQNYHTKNLIRRRIELSLLANQIGHLLGRNGNLHKSIMKETGTRIHFNNAPYSISSLSRCPAFDLDLFQSSSTLTATITGDTEEAVNNATKALEELERRLQKKLRNLRYK